MQLLIGNCLQADYHGCPYKTWGAEQLAAVLGQMNLSSTAIRETVNKAKGGHYQLACGLAFEGVHACGCDSGINHPNQVLDFSIKAIFPQKSKHLLSELKVAASCKYSSQPTIPACLLLAHPIGIEF